MRLNKLIFTIVVIGFSLGIANAQSGTASTTQPGNVFEGKLIFSRDIPVGLAAGTQEHPRLVEIKSIRFETTFGNAWGVTARVGWLPVIDASWKLRAELLDEQGRLLRHPLDEEIILTCKASEESRPTMQYADLDMDAIHDQGRRHAGQFKVYLEPLDEQFEPTETAEIKMHTLEITVIEQESKKPVADASVKITTFNMLNGNRRYQSLYKTDSQGRCKISISANKLFTLGIEVQKQGLASMTKSWSNSGSWPMGGGIPLINPPQRHTFEMLPALQVGGIVQDKDGNAIGAAEVRFNAYMDEPSGRISVRRSVQTDANGQWRVDGVPSEAERISIGLKHPEYGGDHGANRRITGEALLNARALKLVETLDKGITVTGKVLDEDEQPVAGATAMLAQQSSLPFYGITDSNGSFRFVCSGDSDSYEQTPAVIVEAPGYAPAMKAIDIEPNLEPLEFQLNRGKTIKCLVVDSEGKPVEGTWTVVQPLPDNSDYSVWLEGTDKTGEFEIPNVPDGSINLTVGKQGFITIRDYALAPSKQEFTIPLKRALTLHGTVTDAWTKKPIPSFEIATVYSYGDRARTGNPVVFADGTYEMSFEEASEQSWQLQVSAVGYDQITSAEIKNDQGRHALNFQLARASDFDERTAGQPRRQVQSSGPRIITGIVRDDKGVPVSGAVISSRPSLGTETTTNASGKFRFRARRMPGSMGMTSSGITEQAYLLARQKERNLAAAILLDETTDNPVIKLSTGVIFSGKVVDVDGKGIAGASIDLIFWTTDIGYGGNEKVEIDSEGNFEIRAIPAGYRYSVHTSANGYGREDLSVQTSETGETNIELEPLILAIANLSVSGVVVDTDDKPVAGVRIACSGRGQPYRNTKTNTEGKFTLDKVCEGMIRISANKSGQTRLYGYVQTEGGASDVKIIISERPTSTQFVPKLPPSLVGKSLPDLKELKFDQQPDDTTGEMVLVCFFDMQQRPSRNCLMQLSKRAQQLKEKGIAVIAVQVAKIDKSTLDEWVKEYKIPFAVGMIETEQEKARFAWGVRSLPWLILTDKNHVVRSQGFALTALDEQLKQINGE